MAAKPAIEIQGLRPLQKRLREAKDDGLNAALKAAHRESADLVATSARPRVPVRTGRLLRSMRTASSLRSGRVALGRKSVPYAGPVHFGWANRPNKARGWRGGPIAPNPFLYDALHAKAGAVVERFEKQIDNLTAKVNGD